MDRKINRNFHLVFNIHVPTSRVDKLLITVYARTQILHSLPTTNTEKSLPYTEQIISVLCYIKYVLYYYNILSRSTRPLLFQEYLSTPVETVFIQGFSKYAFRPYKNGSRTYLFQTV